MTLRLLLATLAIALTACSSQIVGVPPSLDKPVVNYPGDTRAFYRDGEASHVITLNENGTYTFESSDPYGGASSRSGLWKWRTSGTHKAELTLDTNVWILTFASHDSAIAVNNSAPGRTFAFQFERL